MRRGENCRPQDRAGGTIKELIETGTVGDRRNTTLRPDSFDGWIDTASATGEIAFHVEEIIEQLKRQVLSEYKARSAEEARNIASAQYRNRVYRPRLRGIR